MKRAKFEPSPFLVLKNPYFCRPNGWARVAELVDALDSKSCSFGSAGSIPASGTREETFSRESPFFVFKLCIVEKKKVAIKIAIRSDTYFFTSI